MVFFDSLRALKDFAETSDGKPSELVTRLPSKVKKLTTVTDKDTKEFVIKQAPTAGSITLLTREYGRGTDFICRDQTLNQNGGVHVIQAFVSLSKAEELQIKGRTARQNTKGSFSIVVRRESLEQFGITKAELDGWASEGKLFPHIDDRRLRTFEDAYTARNEDVKDSSELHTESIAFMDHLARDEKKPALDFLLRMNAPPAEAFGASRTIVLMDATGSMGSCIDSTKKAVKEVFRRAGEIPRRSFCKPRIGRPKPTPTSSAYSWTGRSKRTTEWATRLSK